MKYLNSETIGLRMVLSHLDIIEVVDFDVRVIHQANKTVFRSDQNVKTLKYRRAYFDKYKRKSIFKHYQS